MEHDHSTARREPPALGQLPVRGTDASYERNSLSNRVGRRWNTAHALARYFDGTPTLYRGLHVLELGASTGLPGLVAAKSGARTVRVFLLEQSSFFVLNCMRRWC